MHHYVKSSNETLRKRGYRLTPQRHMILSVIQEADGHLNIDQILERVQERNPYVSLSTVYRTLELLRELGLVRENHLPGEQPHYETAESAAHHHLVCRRCRGGYSPRRYLTRQSPRTVAKTVYFSWPDARPCSRRLL